MSAISPKKYCLFKLFEILWHCTWPPLPYSFTPSVHLLVRKSLFFSSIIILKLSLTQWPKKLEFSVLLHTQKEMKGKIHKTHEMILRCVAWERLVDVLADESGCCEGYGLGTPLTKPHASWVSMAGISLIHECILRIISRLPSLAKCKHLVMLNNIYRETSPFPFSPQLELFHWLLSMQSPTDRRESPESFVCLIMDLLFVSQVCFPGYLWQISMCVAVPKQQYCLSLLICSIFLHMFSNLFINLLLGILWKQ